MQLVEKHIVSRNSPLFSECDRICFASKNIYNRVLYLVKQEYENTKTYGIYNDMYGHMKDEECLKVLPMKVSQATLRMTHGVIKSFFALLKLPKVPNVNVNFPHFLNKEKGRYVAMYNNQTISKKVFKKAHKIKLTQSTIEFYTKVENFEQIDCVTICPGRDMFTINVVYTIPEVEKQKCNRKYAAIDLGVNNLAAITFSERGKSPILISGRPLKSINQFYNKELAETKSKLERINKKKRSHKINKLNNKRTNKVNDYLHKTSKYIVSNLMKNCVTTLIIGQNVEWKTQSNIGTKNNQNFVQIPHSRFINMLRYKCEKVGITVKLQEESYTSKCSFLDREEICKHENYVGKRVKRGLFVSANGQKINADINGSYNIMRKALPSTFSHGIEGVVVRPMIIIINNFYKRK